MNDYQAYLNSPEWEETKQTATKKLKVYCCAICKAQNNLEWHHYKGYAAIWTKDDYTYIVLLCRICHQRNHFTLRKKKILLEKKTLYRRYRFLKWSYPVRNFRASIFLTWIWNLYRVEE